ncbi:hypothetical protein DLAC_06924 [Tieghemostelium lacteum]|uniref:DNA-directed RNA polymerase III subunit n=1 Tax=Tieghemostelium lacteum TaxID=361077 RepID=A0A151ZDR5_TIELA|nr:hypothetical protein DLAC_06924 [Tieghemostelium lacteum]|eukprot:KYQ92087.1 hypothetical protein DLAC_06924 [Tieghemostelium lacteum]
MFGNRFGGGSGNAAFDRKKDDDDDDEEKEEVNSKIPKPLYPIRKDIPQIPRKTLDTYSLVHKLIRIRNRFEYSIYHLRTDEESKPDGIDRHSNRFKTSRKDQNPLEKQLNLDYFPQELTQNRRKARKKKKNIDFKNLDAMQKQEEKGEKSDEESGTESEDSSLESETSEHPEFSDDEDISDGDDGDKEQTL